MSCSSGDVEKPVHSPGSGSAWESAAQWAALTPATGAASPAQGEPGATECARPGTDGKSGWGLGIPNQLHGRNFSVLNGAGFAGP